MADAVAASMATLGASLLMGDFLRTHVRVLESLHLPASLIGGMVLWLGLTAMELVDSQYGYQTHPWILGKFMAGWHLLPGVMTTVIFAGLVLGQPLASPKQIWIEAGDHLLYGLSVVFGQYTFCTLVTALILMPNGTSRFFAPVIPLGFQGGHGVVSGMQEAFQKYDYNDGYTVGMAAASLGLMVGVIFGSYCVNWGDSRSYLVGLAAIDPDGAREVNAAPLATAPSVSELQMPQEMDEKPVPLAPRDASNVSLGPLEPEEMGLRRSEVVRRRRRRKTHFSLDDQPAAGKQVVGVESLDTLAYHCCLLGLAIGGGLIMRWGMGEVFGPTIGSFPLFPFCLVSSVIFQMIINRAGIPVDRQTIERIVNTSQDAMILSGMALLDTSELIKQGFAFLVASTAAFAWAVFAIFILARLVLPDYWLERGLIECGLSLGSTATGLMLLRMGDPENRTPVLRQFGFKQIIHVSIVGGGAFDALSLNIVNPGIWYLFGSAAFGLVFCLVAGKVNRLCAAGGR